MDETDVQVAAATVTPAEASVRSRRRFDSAFRRLSVEMWQASALSAADFCRREGLNPKSFARWRSQIAGDDVAGDPPRSPVFVPVVVTTAAAVPEPANPSSAPGHAESGVEIVLRGDRRLRVSRNFDELSLRRLVQVLESLQSIGDGEPPRC